MTNELQFKLEYTVSEDDDHSAAAIILAAGRAVRMGGADKVLADLAGEPVLCHSLRAFSSVAGITSIVVAASRENMLAVQKICEGFPKVTDIVEGGAEREGSVAAALDRVRARYTLTHDAARPLVTREVIERVLRALETSPAAVPGVPVRDTVKVVRGGEVMSTPKRDTLIAAQTPQGFDTAVLRGAIAKVGDLSRFTDECSIVEAAGVPVRVVEGDQRNIKITFPSDMELVEALIKGK